VASFRYGALFAITLTMTVFALTMRDSSAARTIEMLAAGVALVVAVVTSRAELMTRRALAIAIAGIVLGATVASIAGSPPPEVPLGIAAVLLAITIGVVSRGLLRLILHRGVDLTAIFGALSVYLLVGLAFAFLIGAIATGTAGDYFAQGTDGTQADRVYFSFTSLTTTGFGDYTARTRGGHALSVLEMLMGQLYLVTVISLLVGNLRHERDEAPAPRRAPSAAADGGGEEPFADVAAGRGDVA
jgi:hypothetical protein